MKRIKVGIVGCGGISRIHIPVLRKIRECSIFAVCDLIEERARHTADRWQILKHYTDFGDMLRKESLDVVYVLTGPNSHPILSIQAMEAGCHVLVEKPMSVTLKEADEMVEASRKNGVELCVSHSFIHTPPVLKARELVKNSSLGEIVEVDTVVSIDPLMKHNHPKWMYKLPGGIYGEIIPHGLYTELAFLKSVEVVRCLRRGKFVKRGVPFKDMCALLFSERGFGRLLLTSRLRSSFTVAWLNVIGSEASVTVTIPSGSIVQHKLKNDDKPTNRSFRAMMNLSSSWQLFKGTITTGLKALRGQIHSYVSYETLSRRFIRSVIGEGKNPVTPEEGREVVKVTEMIWDKLGIARAEKH